MPTRRIAEKSAALEAIKLLHEAGELDEYLRPISRLTDLSDDEHLGEREIIDGRKKHAGTVKRSNYYPNMVKIK